MSLDLSVTLKSGIAAKDRRERKKDEPQMDVDLRRFGSELR
jgi:hypothetical protein